LKFIEKTVQLLSHLTPFHSKPRSSD